MAEGATAPQSMTVSDADTGDTARAEAQKRVNLLLLGAIISGDAEQFEKAARAKADVNFDGGKPLQIAAQHKNTLFLRLLLTRGADVSHAVSALGKEQAKIKRTRKYDDYGYGDYTYAFKNKEEERRWKLISAAVKTLNDYEKTYRDTIAPLEAVRLQQQMLDELRDMKAEITTALHGKPLTKAKLPAPKTGRP